MNIFLWVISSVGFVLSIIMFMPSIMSLSAPRFKTKKSIENWSNYLIGLFLKCVLIYPILYLLTIILSLIFSIEFVIYLVTYLLFTIVLFLSWIILERYSITITKK